MNHLKTNSERPQYGPVIPLSSKERSYKTSSVDICRWLDVIAAKGNDSEQRQKAERQREEAPRQAGWNRVNYVPYIVYTV